MSTSPGNPEDMIIQMGSTAGELILARILSTWLKRFSFLSQMWDHIDCSTNEVVIGPCEVLKIGSVGVGCLSWNVAIPKSSSF